ncbi:MAG: 6-phosphofructokinase [Oscillospiraceae bacterium]|jgi:6-phosphofructokinase 1|nr:6-phosphofructokinase [Oscillospiraceae bacterium]
MKNRTIAVLTSGGDAPGMNACIRAVVRTALNSRAWIFGVRRGYDGLINENIFRMDFSSVSDIIHRGGTMLYTARSPQFKTPKGLKKAALFCKDKKINGIITIGGDGTFRGAMELGKMGIPCICVPGTIDNDVGFSEYTIGFDTAMNTAIDMIDKIRDTAQSHNRCSIVEVMGRHCGRIALYTGIAVGAVAILIPEKPCDFEKDIVNPMKNRLKYGKHHFIIVVSEGVGNIDKLAVKIKNEVQIETRTTVLGHVQRGGAPTLRDRVLASEMGYKAAKLLCEGEGNCVLAAKNGRVVKINMEEAANMKKEFKDELYEAALKIR